MSAEPPETSSLPPLLLCTDRVRGGDVLLTLGSEKKSAAIARFSGGRYSHAALCVNSEMIFESDGGVVDRKFFEDLGWATIAGSPARLGAVPGRPAQFALYRHPRMSDVSESRFKEALLEEMSESYGKDYSEMFRLAALAQTAPAIKAVLDSYYRIEHKLRHAENVPGPFCSELVARVYERLGLSLFSKLKRSEQVSPSDLAESNLEKIEDVVVPSNGLSIQSSPVSPFDAWIRSPEWKDPFALYLNWQRKVAGNIDPPDEIKGAIAEVRLANARVLSLSIEGFGNLVPLVGEHVKEASGTDSPQVLARALELSKRCMSLATRLPTVMSAYANSDWDVVLTIVRDLKQFERSLVRCNCLLQLHQRKVRRLLSNRWQRWRNDRTARRIVAQIRLQGRHLLKVDEMVLDALVSQREAEAFLTAK